MESDLSLWEEKLEGRANISSTANYYVADLQLRAAHQQLTSRAATTLTTHQQLASRAAVPLTAHQQLASSRGAARLTSNQQLASGLTSHSLAYPLQQLASARAGACTYSPHQPAASGAYPSLSFTHQLPLGHRDPTFFYHPQQEATKGGESSYPQHSQQPVIGNGLHHPQQQLPTRGCFPLVAYSPQEMALSTVLIGGVPFYLLERGSSTGTDLYEDVDSDYGDTVHSSAACLTAPALPEVHRSSRALPLTPQGH